MNTKTPSKPEKKVNIFWAVVLPCTVAALVPIMIIVARQISLNKINSFEACQDAKGEIIESRPEQCKINNKTFTDNSN